MSPKKKLNTDQLASEFESDSAFFRSTNTQVEKSTSPQVDKPTKPQVEKYTTHLRPTTIKAVKRYALDQDKKDYEIVQEALDLYFQSKDMTT
jgi:hypothetical protein